MTHNEQALFNRMQDMGYSHGLCITAIRILSQSGIAVTEMLAYVYDEHPNEDEFIQEMARICQACGLDPLG